MRRWLVLVFVLAGCSGSGVSLADYPSAFRDAYCKYLTRCGEFPDISTCQSAYIGITLRIDPSSQAEIDMGKVLFDGALAQDCLDAFGAQTCDATDEDGRALFPVKCRDITQGTVGDGGACASSGECKSKVCNVPTCSMACCQGTCTGNSEAPLGGAGAACTSSNACAVGFYCDFTMHMCAELKAAGATCSSSSECAFDLGCAGTTTRTCKKLPALGEACPDGVCRDVGTYCNAAGQCAKTGLAGSSCTGLSGDCSSYYPCDTSTMKCTKAPGLGEPCTNRCFDDDTFCDTSAASPTCIKRRPDGGICTGSSQCENNDCALGSGTGAGTCTTPAVCI